MRSLYGADAQEVGGALVVVARALPDVPMLNRALGLGLLGPATRGGVAEIRHALAGTTAYVAVAPGTGIEGLLEECGLEPGYAWAKFARDASPAAAMPTELRVERIGPRHEEAFAAVVSRGYGMPNVLARWFDGLSERNGWSLYIAFAGDEPVSAGGLFVQDGAGWLGLMATLPERRGLGGQGALMAARIERARALGCDVIATETGALEEGRPGNSYRNILRHGFEVAYVRPNRLLRG